MGREERGSVNGEVKNRKFDMQISTYGLMCCMYYDSVQIEG